jgi:hypothetical protein
MKNARRPLAIRLAAVFLCAGIMFLPVTPARAYSVLSHEEVVDMAWKTTIVPMLKQRFPGITDDDIRQAHAYAYGGSVIQDIGYYPFGSHYFSDLLHYVRPQEFVDALIRDSTTPNEYAFALGALAHYCGDIIGHPAINEVTSEENPPLRHRFGRIVTYGEDPTAHIRTEFGFDVVEVAQGHYSQENYRDFIGFQVSRDLMNKAFQETYGIPVSSVLTHEDLAIGTYRRAVSSLIPKMTRLAFVSYKSQIQQATPGIEKKKFLYRLNQTEFKKDFGTEYYHTGFWGQVASGFLRLIPKVGPFKALKVTLPDPHEQDVYIKSVNSTVDRYKVYLAEIHAAPAPLPPPDAKDAADARKAADKVAKEAAAANHRVDTAHDPDDKASLARVADAMQKTSDKANAAADRTEERVAAVEVKAAAFEAKTGDPAPAFSANAIPADTPIQPPSIPNLPKLDLDTGQPSQAGEYALADQAYAKLLASLVKTASKNGPSATTVDSGIAADIQRFFAHRVPPTALPAVDKPNPKTIAKATALQAQEQTYLATLQTLISDSSAAKGASASAPSNR